MQPHAVNDEHLETDLFREVVRYLRRKITLHDLEDWLGNRTAYFLSAPPSPAVELAGTIELELAELSLGYQTEDGLRRTLSQFTCDATARSSAELVSKISQYLEHRLTLRELEAWLVAQLSVLLATRGTQAERLANTIELWLYELGDGIWSERSIRNRLARELAAIRAQARTSLVPDSGATAAMVKASAGTGTAVLQNVPPVAYGAGSGRCQVIRLLGPDRAA